MKEKKCITIMEENKCIAHDRFRVTPTGRREQLISRCRNAVIGEYPSAKDLEVA